MIRAMRRRTWSVVGIVFLLTVSSGQVATAQAPVRSGPPPRQGPPPRATRGSVKAQQAHSAVAPPAGTGSGEDVDAEIAQRREEGVRAALLGSSGTAPSSSRTKTKRATPPPAAAPINAAQAAFDLGQAYEKQSKAARAINSYRDVLEFAPEGDLAKRARERITALSPQGVDTGALPYGDLLSPAQLADLRRTRPLPVLKVNDGDEIQVFRNGRAQTVKLAGVEVDDQAASGLARRPADHLRSLLKGRTVFLVPSSEPKDDEAPIVAHVYCSADGLWINRTMAADGFATALPDAPDSLKKADSAARTAGLGRWASRK
jgi:hypothetical protein